MIVKITCGRNKEYGITAKTVSAANKKEIG